MWASVWARLSMFPRPTARLPEQPFQQQSCRLQARKVSWAEAGASIASFLELFSWPCHHDIYEALLPEFIPRLLQALLPLYPCSFQIVLCRQITDVPASLVLQRIAEFFNWQLQNSKIRINLIRTQLYFTDDKINPERLNDLTKVTYHFYME